MMVLNKQVKAMSTIKFLCGFFFFWIQISVCKPIIIVRGEKVIVKTEDFTTHLTEFDMLFRLNIQYSVRILTIRKTINDLLFI